MASFHATSHFPKSWRNLVNSRMVGHREPSVSPSTVESWPSMLALVSADRLRAPGHRFSGECGPSIPELFPRSFEKTGELMPSTKSTNFLRQGLARTGKHRLGLETRKKASS